MLEVKPNHGFKRGILAIDPGLATGIAWWSDDPRRAYTEVLDPEKFYDWVYTNLASFDLVVVEDFVISQQTMRKSRQNWSIEHIGFVRGLAYLNGVRMEVQQASAAKSFCKNETLKRIGWWRPVSAGGHDNDALRHLLLTGVKHAVYNYT